MRLEYNARISYARLTLHEAIHLAANTTWYLDYELAKALVDLGYLSQEKFQKLDPDPKHPLGASTAWNDVL